MFNYADDNSISVSEANFDDATHRLEIISETIMNWFANNYMQANPDKFQIISCGRNDAITHHALINIGGQALPVKNDVVLLGVYIDHKLNFSQQISLMCSKAGEKISPRAI